MALSPNAHVETVKSARWAAVLCLLGEGGDKVMMDLLLDCGLFCAEADGNVFQVSGKFDETSFPTAYCVGRLAHL